jgi:hypothetical protein
MFYKFSLFSFCSETYTKFPCDTETFVPVEASLTNCCSGHAPQHAYDIITMTLQGLVVRSVPVHLTMVSVFASSLWSPQISFSSRLLADCQWWKKVFIRFFKNYFPLLLLSLYVLKYFDSICCDVRTPYEALQLSHNESICVVSDFWYCFYLNDTFAITIDCSSGCGAIIIYYLCAKVSFSCSYHLFYCSVTSASLFIYEKKIIYK